MFTIKGSRPLLAIWRHTNTFLAFMFSNIRRGRLPRRATYTSTAGILAPAEFHADVSPSVIIRHRGSFFSLTASFFFPTHTTWYAHAGPDIILAAALQPPGSTTKSIFYFLPFSVLTRVTVFSPSESYGNGFSLKIYRVFFGSSTATSFTATQRLKTGQHLDELCDPGRSFERTTKHLCACDIFTYRQI